MRRERELANDVGHAGRTLGRPAAPRGRCAMVLSLAASLLLGLVPRIAPAQPSPAASSSTSPAPPPASSGAAPAPGVVSAQDKAFAAAKYEAAADFARKGDWRAAHPLFLEAWGRFKHWQIALNLGRTEIEIGKFHAAEGHLSFALTSAELPAADRPEVARLIAIAKAKQGAVRLIATAPSEARVWLDDRRIGVTPFSGVVSADPGDHRIEIRLGSARKARLVTVATGQTRDVDIDLRVADLLEAATKTTAPDEAPSAAETSPPAVSPSPLKIGVLIAGGGLAVTAYAIGVGTSVACNDLARIREERISLCTGAVSSLLVGALLTGGALAAFFAWPDNRAQKKADLRLHWTGLGARAELRW